MPHSQAQQSLNAVHFTLPWEFEWMPVTIPILCGFINSAHWGFFYFIFVLIPPVSKFKEFSRHCSSPSPTGWLFENLDPWKCNWVEVTFKQKSPTLIALREPPPRMLYTCLRVTPSVTHYLAFESVSIAMFSCLPNVSASSGSSRCWWQCLLYCFKVVTLLNFSQWHF